ncbi:hypothetical protein B0T18DRAFT_361701 [Schizothecium vesticola]|uniref:FAD-binding PCMH-type domain-containing protein n=1 Tax=Schizothecium vesticola TaxID=314040 RepID=A0AA40F4X8_9PEZI|nr:hypothetical protein B0T18DRAFT_361701 [Schizothecium vesticola]
MSSLHYFRAKLATLALLSVHIATQAFAVPSGQCPPKFAFELGLTDSSLAEAIKNHPNIGAQLAFGDKNKLGPAVDCKVFPGDEQWPSRQTWNAFNASVEGALIETVPLAAPCYNNWPQRDATRCQAVTDRWSDPRLHVNDPSSTQWPIFQGRTCLPTDDPTRICTLGGYASYSVASTKVSQIQLAINFARNANLRLVVMNTGHDFADKSIGAGALSIWTHNLKDIKYYADYDCKGYKGPAFKLGAGVETEEVYKAAEENEVTVVGGECRTVGLVGGFTAGGGHSPLSSLVGMGADQVLSMEVVLPDGRYATADGNTNPDLFWALRGGGGSTYGVVTSIVIKAYHKMPVTTMTFSFVTSPTVSADTFWAGVNSYFSHFDRFTSAGAYGYFLVVSIGPSQYLFNFMPFWGSNMTAPQLRTLVDPFLADLTKLGVPITPNITEYPSFYTAYVSTFPPEQVGASVGHAASRIFPRENFSQPPKRNATVAAVRYAVDAGGVLIGYNMRSAPNDRQENAVNPAWRKSTGFFILTSPNLPPTATDEEIAAAAETLTTDWMERWRGVSPGGGAYMSEGDINEPDFQGTFYGREVYDRLKALKRRYDPWDLFWVVTGVGSEGWAVAGQREFYPTQNGRLCRRKS